MSSGGPEDEGTRGTTWLGLPAIRAHERFEVPWQARLRCPDWKAAERIAITNVSQGGMFLHTQERLSVGQPVRITLELPSGHQAHLQAHVRHLVTPDSAGEQNAPTGVGVEVTPESRKEMAALIEIARMRMKERPAPAPAAGPQAPAPGDGSPKDFACERAAAIIGIDFGVSYSGVSVAVGDTVHIIPDAHGRTRLPSLVAFPEGRAQLVGWDARRLQVTRPDRCIASVKRLLGLKYADPSIAGYLHSMPFPTRAGPEETILIEVDGEPLAVVQICAQILGLLRQVAEQRLGRAATKVVLNTPVGFGSTQRDALARAARLAGLEPVAMIDEALAGALAYGHGRGKNEIIAVYDFGGGTFDFTVIDMSASQYRVLVTDGDSWLGGDDFDEKLAGAVANAFWRRTGVDLRQRAVEWQRVLFACEGAKRQLSVVERAAVEVPRIVETPGPIDLVQPVDRRALQRVCSDLFDRSLEVCRRALQQIDLEPRDLTSVVITGGTTLIPFVRAGLERFFERELKSLVDPENAVALGTGIHAVREAAKGQQ